MAFGHHASGGHHGGNTAAYLGNLAHGRRVGGGGVQTQEARLTNHLAACVRALHGNIVQPGRAVYRGPRHGFGHQHQFVGFQQGHGFSRQMGLQGVNRAAQNAQTGFGLGYQTDPIAFALEFIVTGAQEGEVAVFQPAQKIDAFLTVGGLQ